MTIKCANCGQVLPRNNARFCNSCGSPIFSEEDTIFPDESAGFQNAVEDLPTAHVEAHLPEPPIRRPIGPARGAINPVSTEWDSHIADVTQLSTSRHVSQRPVEPLKQQEQFMQAGGVVFPKSPLTPRVSSIPQTPTARPQFQVAPPVQKGRQPGLVPPTPPIDRPAGPKVVTPKPVGRQGKGRKRVLLILTLLLLLVASGIAAWIVIIKPFAVPSITQPWQRFCESGLGVSGQYPTGWTRQVDTNKGVHFSDGTDQFGIVAVAGNGQDATQYLQKEASQLGITGLKLRTPVSFAEASWQQAQGSLLQSQTGVTYTETLFVTNHGNRFYTIMQIAPPSTYNEEDATIFSGMRSSFQFSSNCS